MMGSIRCASRTRASALALTICDGVWPAAKASSCETPSLLGLARFAAIGALIATTPALPVSGWLAMALPSQADTGSGAPNVSGADVVGQPETLVAGYVGNPIYYRSNVHLSRPGGTNLVLQGVGWDGDPLHFPIDGGVRWVRWAGRSGFMIDFFHAKAIARLGRGAHGRRLRYPVVEEVPVKGTLNGQPAPARMRLTDMFERLEFTHGHNMLFFTGLMRMATPLPMLVPYAGIGAGAAIPHTEVWFKGEGKKNRTNEYQLAGPAAQLLAGLELRVGRVSYFVEYKFNYAWIWGALTADKSWKNWNMPGDLYRQFTRWWRGEEPRLGQFYTTLGAHQLNFGAGYRWPGTQPVRLTNGTPPAGK